MPRDYYEVLGLKREATEADIKKAHRRLARQFHPDRNPGDKQAEERFKEVQEAYDVLSDKNKRAQYDHYGFVGPHPGPGAGPRAQGFSWGRGGGAGPQAVDPQELEEMFRQAFGEAGGLNDFFARGTRGRRQRPPEPEPRAAPEEESEHEI